MININFCNYLKKINLYHYILWQPYDCYLNSVFMTHFHFYAFDKTFEINMNYRQNCISFTMYGIILHLQQTQMDHVMHLWHYEQWYMCCIASVKKIQEIILELYWSMHINNGIRFEHYYNVYVVCTVSIMCPLCYH